MEQTPKYLNQFVLLHPCRAWWRSRLIEIDAVVVVVVVAVEVAVVVVMGARAHKWA